MLSGGTGASVSVTASVSLQHLSTTPASGVLSPFKVCFQLQNLEFKRANAPAKEQPTPTATLRVLEEVGAWVPDPPFHPGLGLES